MNVNMDEIIDIQNKLNSIDNWNLKHFNMWEDAKGNPMITIRLKRKSTGA